MLYPGKNKRLVISNQKRGCRQNVASFYFCTTDIHLTFMKLVSFVLLFIVAVIFPSCHNENKPQEILGHYENGTISRKHTLINGKKEGLMTEYYKDGNLKAEMHFENDIQVGKATFYYPSGKVEEVQYFDQGKLHGGDTVFYEDGTPKFVRTFHHGLKDGYLRKWDSTGVMIYEVKFSMDTLKEVEGVPVNKTEPMEKDTFLNK